MRAPVLATLLLACAPDAPPPTPAPLPNTSATRPLPPQGGGQGTGPEGTAAPVASTAPTDSPAPDHTILPDRALTLLFPDEAPDLARACLAAPEPVDCLLAERYREDALALTAARALHRETGSIAGLEARQRIDGGWRGEIDLVPEPPIGRHRRHLEWLLAAERDFVEFFDALEHGTAEKPRYRYRPIELRFFRSVGRTTPSAYANGWSVAYNVAGSLNLSETAVRETLFHEVFHLNDAARGGWSARSLEPIYQRVVAGCTRGGHANTACLAPFTPNHTMVRGGTFYAFQPGNGVAEYAAELALRYYREQRAALAGRPPPAPFKCGPPENAETWQLLVTEFFAGIDRVPPCRGAKPPPLEGERAGKGA